MLSFTILPMGGAGEGKSTLCNLLSGTNTFQESDSVEGGATREITFVENYALGNPRNPTVKVFDTPGFGDPDLPLQIWISEFKDKVKGKLDMAIAVINPCNPRTSLVQIMTMRSISDFIEELKPRNIFVCFTYCDKMAIQNTPFVASKVKKLEQYLGKTIESDRIIFSDMTPGKLQSFVAKYVHGEGRIIPNVEEKVTEFAGNLPKIIQNSPESQSEARMLRAELTELRHRLQQISVPTAVVNTYKKPESSFQQACSFGKTMIVPVTQAVVTAAIGLCSIS